MFWWLSLHAGKTILTKRSGYRVDEIQLSLGGGGLDRFERGWVAAHADLGVEPDWNGPDYDDGWIQSELDRQHWEAQELAREAHDVEVMIDWEQELRQLGL